MDDIKEFVKNLRWYASYASDPDQELMYKAAEVIEDLSAKIEKTIGKDNES